VTDDIQALIAQRIGERDHIPGELVRRVVIDPTGLVRQVVAAQIRCNGPKARLGERW
jgi:hypothetical protein